MIVKPNLIHSVDMALLVNESRTSLKILFFVSNDISRDCTEFISVIDDIPTLCPVVFATIFSADKVFMLHSRGSCSSLVGLLLILM